jgi:hypothetical protein
VCFGEGDQLNGMMEGDQLKGMINRRGVCWGGEQAERNDKQERYVCIGVGRRFLP